MSGGPLRGRWRRLILGLMTVTGIARRGYFIPYRFASSLPAASGHGAYPALEAILASQADGFAAFAGRMSECLPDLLHAVNGAAPAPRLDQDWFPPFDALAAYTMVRSLRPGTILEIGGGHSTRFFVRAALDGGLRTEIAVVDPGPRRGLARLAASGRITLHECPVQALELAQLPALGPGDILSLDGSHILVPGSDADLVLNRLLPGLPAGAVVHFHDIFLPDPYPEGWEWRGYNEQQGVAALLCGGAVQVLFASHFVLSRLSRMAAGAGLAALPGSVAPASSLWLRRAE